MISSMKKLFATSTLLFLTTSSSCFAFDVISIPDLGGVAVSARAINESDEIVGVSTTQSPGNHAFKYNLDTALLDDLGAPVSGSSQANGINSEGDIVGQVVDLSLYPEAQAFLLLANSPLFLDLGVSEPFFVHPHTKLTPLSSNAFGINDKKDICGTQICLDPNNLQILRPLFFNKMTGMIDLGVPHNGANAGEAFAINNNSVIVGVVFDEDDNAHAAIWKMKDDKWSASKVDEIILIEGFRKGTVSSKAEAINNHNEVVGCYVMRSTLSRAFLWTEKHGVVDLGTLGGNTFATAINDRGVVAGISNGEAFAWSWATGMVDLGMPADAVTGINDEGTVIVVLNNQSFAVKTNNFQ